MKVYNPVEIEQRLITLPSWRYQDSKLQCTFRFKSFKQAFSFMTKVADYAETIDHHPDWCNRYNKVDVSLITHSKKGITELDFKLAVAMKNIAQQLSAS